jgi:GNAT superfamily N-acetyltransferase
MKPARVAKAPPMIQTRPMIETDIEAGLRLCRASGWNQLEADWRGFLESSPRGCRVAVCDRVVGTVATLNFQEKFGWISMLLVDPQWRGQGIGTRLLEEACQVLSGVETVRLDATPAGKLVYDKAGFQDEYPLVRMKAAAPGVEGLSEVGAVVRDVVRGIFPVVRNIGDSDWPRLLAWDRLVFGADRSAILRRLFGDAPEYAWLAESAGEIHGFLMGRHGFLAEHLGPLVALDELTARALAAAGMRRAQGRPLMIDAPRHNLRDNQEWNRWLEARGFREERPFIRMYRGTNSHAGLPGLVFAIAGPELG